MIPLRNMFDPADVEDADKIYHFADDELLTCINVAIAIGRPLLLTGQAGVGKSSVARGVAHGKRWGRFSRTITSRMDADDLKADFDAVGRLSDAASKAADKAAYVTPGVLWQAYDPEGARTFLQDRNRPIPKELADSQANAGRVLLIDEIDKGNLDFANDLLDVFDDGKFTVPVIDRAVERQGDRNLLVVITSNGEREFSRAFLRRCIEYRMVARKKSDAAAIGKAHLLRREATSSLLNHERLAELAACTSTASDAREAGADPEIDVATFVDLIDVVLKFEPSESDWPAFRDAIEEFARTRRGASFGGGNT